MVKQNILILKFVPKVQQFKQIMYVEYTYMYMTDLKTTIAFLIITI